MQTIMLSVGWKYLRLWKPVQVYYCNWILKYNIGEVHIIFNLFHDTLYFELLTCNKKHLFLWVLMEKPYFFEYGSLIKLLIEIWI